MERADIVHNLDGEAGSHTGVDHRRGMSHDAAALQVAEAVDKRTHGPLHCCGHREGDEAQSWAQNSAVARVKLRRVPHSKHSGTNGQHGGSADPAACAVTVFIVLIQMSKKTK